MLVYNNNNILEYDISDVDEYTYIIKDEAQSTIKIGKLKMIH